MPSIMCNCGESLRYGEIPNPNEWLVISDVDYDDYCGDINSEALFREMKHFLKCPGCDRLWIYWDGFGSKPRSYLPE